MWQSTSITRLSKPSSCVTRLPNQTPFCGSHSILTSSALMALRPALRRAASSLRRSRRDLKSVHCPFSHSSLDSLSAISKSSFFTCSMISPRYIQRRAELSNNRHRDRARPLKEGSPTHSCLGGESLPAAVNGGWDLPVLVCEHRLRVVGTLREAERASRR